MPRIVADLGNSRLKWGTIGEDGRVADPVTLPADDESAWALAWPGGGAATSWAVSSVNPPAAGRLAEFLKGRGVRNPAWYRSAADVPVRHGLDAPGTAGADRALAVVAALADRGGAGPGLVVLCGTAVTVERVAADGTWQGGAIAAGLAPSARALHALTAQLPLVAPRDTPPAWGRSTSPAIEAGVFWGVAGGVRELIDRQSDGLGPGAWVVWTGGDAPSLASAVGRQPARVVPDLVLRGLAAVAFGAQGVDR